MPDPVDIAAAALRRVTAGRVLSWTGRQEASLVLGALATAGYVVVPIASAPHARPTQFTLSLLPEGDINRSAFEVTVEYRGRDRWAVLEGAFCLGTDGVWDYESLPGNREDEWLATHRFDIATALRLAEEALPNVNCNGTTARDYMARKAAEEVTPDA